MNAWPGRSVPCKVLRPASPRLSSPVFLPREEKNASPRVRRFSLATPAHSLLTLPPYHLLSLFRYIPLSVETLRATSPFGYVRDACNVSVWVCSRCVQCLSLDRQRVCWRRSTLRLYGVVESWDGSVSANSSR